MIRFLCGPCGMMWLLGLTSAYVRKVVRPIHNWPEQTDFSLKQGARHLKGTYKGELFTYFFGFFGPIWAHMGPIGPKWGQTIAKKLALWGIPIGPVGSQTGSLELQILNCLCQEVYHSWFHIPSARGYRERDFMTSNLSQPRRGGVPRQIPRIVPAASPWGGFAPQNPPLPVGRYRGLQYLGDRRWT